MQTSFTDHLDSISPETWNRLVPDSHPFLRHEFLAALERHRCVGTENGWQPRHLLLHSDDGELIGASPGYIKQHSYGEFVFDWAWADAYQRNGLAYYPKQVSCIPFTPINGPRLLTAPGVDPRAIQQTLIRQAIEDAGAQGHSSMHWLFPPDDELSRYEDEGLILRLGCQYHWHNQGYEDFDHYLSHFSARKRKNIVRERRQVTEAGVSFRVLHGDEVSDEEWRLFHRYYREIYDRKWGFPSLTLAFFQEIGRTLADQVVLVLAYQEGDCIAAALNLRSDDALYGRYWGCRDYVAALHFEACYYQGLEYCIKHGLQRFEPGAQGEHKIARGFLPTPTWSAHWIAEPGFREAIGHYVARERLEMERNIALLREQSPFKTSA